MDPLPDHHALVADLAETFAAEQTLVDRLGRAVGGPIRVCLPVVGDIDGTLLRAGRDHLWIADEAGFWVLVSDQVEVVSDFPNPSAAPDELMDTEQNARPGLGSALREIKGSGRSVSVLAGSRWIAGRPTLVGNDFLEVEGAIVPFARIRACRVWY